MKTFTTKFIKHEVLRDEGAGNMAKELCLADNKDNSKQLETSDFHEKKPQ